MHIRGYCFMLCAAFMWGLIGFFSKFLLMRGIDALEIAFWRAALAWIMFLIHAGMRGELKAQRADMPILLIFGFVCVTLFYASYQLAIRDVGMALSAVLLYTAPAWVAFLSWLILGERMTPIKTICVAMTVTGVGAISLGPKLLGGDGIELHILGLLEGLAAGLTYALYYIFGKKWLYRYPTPTIFVYALPFGALCLLPFVDFAPKSLETWLMLIAIAGVCSYGAFTAYYAGLRHLEATRAAVVATFEPLVAAVLAYLAFGEHFGVWGYAGSILIIAAVFIVVLRDKPKEA